MSVEVVLQITQTAKLLTCALALTGRRHQKYLDASAMKELYAKLLDRTHYLR